MAYKCILRRAAIKFLAEQATQKERKKILKIIEGICDNPYVDNKTKFYFDMPPIVLNICQEPGWWIIYHIVNELKLNVFNIGRPTERPRSNRPN